MSKTLARPPYGNCKVLDRSGNLMFRCGPEKVQWYLERSLADVVSTEDPFTIQLTFQPNGPGHVGDEFFLQEKENRCVVCASEERLTMHHVVPRCYRRYFPDELKSHSSHDVVVLCIYCHEDYEAHAFSLKQQIANEYGIPVSGKCVSIDPYLTRVRSAAGTLSRYRPQLPLVRAEELLDVLRDYYKKQEITAEEIESAAAIDHRMTKDFIHYGEWVVRHTPDLEELVRRWRKHFFDTMHPRFLPTGWDKDRSIYPTL